MQQYCHRCAGRAIPLVTGPSQRPEMARIAVERRGVSIAVACRTFGGSQTCYRYSPLLSDENEQITDLLVGLTDAQKSWGFALCFLHLRNVKGHGWNHKRVYRIYCTLELNLRPLMVCRQTIAG
jgi:putative transposase